MSKLPKKTPYLVTKGGRHYFRIRIPDDLHPTFNKKEHSEALGDINRGQAIVQASRLGAVWQARFLSERHAQGIAVSPPLSTLHDTETTRTATLDEIKAIAALSSRDVLYVDEEARIDGDTWILNEDPRFSPGLPLEEAAKNAISGRDVFALQAQVDDWLSAYGLSLPEDEQSRRRGLYAWAQTLSKAVAGKRQRNAGEVVETPPVPELPDSITHAEGSTLPPGEKPAHLLMLRDVLVLWSTKGKRPSPKTIETATRVVGQFEQVCGNPPLQKLTRQHGLQFRDWLLAQGQSPRTAADRLDYVSRLIRFEMQEHQRITANPWGSIRIQGANDPVSVRKYIKPGNLIKLFALPLFQSYELPHVKTAGRDAAYWIPILGAFTGARVTELAQLLVSDIHQEDSLWCISIINEQDWQSVKNAASKRTIPMHQELIRLGLPEYANAMTQAGHERLFPMAPVSALNNAGGPFATWFSKLKISVGWGQENTFHSFRHTIETMLKRKKVYPFDINAYTGHKQRGGDADTTYSHPEPADLVSVVKAIQHDGLELPVVFPPLDWEPPPLLSGLLMTSPRVKSPAQ